jgi:hypothetical protein
LENCFSRVSKSNKSILKVAKRDNAVLVGFSHQIPERRLSMAVGKPYAEHTRIKELPSGWLANKTLIELTKKLKEKAK